MERVHHQGYDATEKYGPRVLSEKDKRVIQLVSQGMKNKEIAEAMGTTDNMIKNYVRVIYDKLGVWNRVELALWYLQHEKEFEPCGGSEK